MGNDNSKTFQTSKQNGFQLVQDIATGTIVFRQQIPDSKEGLQANFDELTKWLDWYEGIHGATVKQCAELARDFVWPDDSPMVGSEAERTAEAIANQIERLG